MPAAGSEQRPCVLCPITFIAQPDRKEGEPWARQHPSTTPVIADLENQMLELQNTVDTLKRLREKGSSAGEAVTPAPRRTPVLRATPEGEPDFPSDFFMKISLPDAVKSYLSMVKRKQSTKQLMAALERGGYPTRSKNFY